MDSLTLILSLIDISIYPNDSFSAKLLASSVVTYLSRSFLFPQRRIFADPSKFSWIPSKSPSID